MLLSTTAGKVLLRSLCAWVSFAAVTAASAQDATWLASPTSGDPTAAANWSSGAVPTGTAIFGASSITSLTFPELSATSVSAFQFNAGAPSYSFSLDSTGAAATSELTFTGLGIVNNSSSAPSFSLTLAGVKFQNSSSAGNAAFSTNGIISGGGLTSGLGLSFENTSTAANATITNHAGGITTFLDSSTAANARITNNFDVLFLGSSNAGNATITNAGVEISIAGAPVWTNGASGFFGSSSAANATITNNWLGHVSFQETSTAGGATIITNDGGSTDFWDNSSGGQARFITNSGGQFHIDVLNSTGTTAGSIEGAGSYFLGAKALTVGSLNTSTEVSGAIDGAGGSLIKVGTGVLTLSGSNTYTGGTTISGGTLQLGNGGTTGSILGNVVNDGVFTINRSNSYSFDGVISGSGTFHQDGSGVTVLSGANTYTGATIVNNGTLVVNNSVASSSLTTVNNGGMLAGTGMTGAVRVNAGGTLAPGGGTPGSSMTAASLALQSGSYYSVSLTPSTSSFANVTGTATLNGATVAVNFGSGNYLAKRYTILNAGNIVGAFDPTTLSTSMPASVKTSLDYDTTHAYLDIAIIFTPPAGGSFAGNQSNVGNAITNFFNSNGSIPLAFSGLTPHGLTQVSGEIGGSSQQTSSQSSTQFMNVMSDPTAAGRGGVGNADGAAGYTDEPMAYTGNAKSKNPRDAFALLTKAPPGASLLDPRWSVWAMGYGGSQTTEGSAVAGTNTSSNNIYGVAVGADYRFSPDTVAGFALAGGGTNYTVVNGGTGRSDLFQAGAFVRHNIGATYLTASAAYGWQDVTTDRYITAGSVDHLRAEFNTNSYSGRLELGRRFLTQWFGGVGVSPYAAVQTTLFELPAYAERTILGSNTFALSYGANTSTATRSELGLRSDKSYALDGAVLTLRGRAAWAHDFNPNSAITATFQTLPGASFVVNGASLAPDAALTTASAEVSWVNGWSIAATFEGEFSDVTRSYAGKGVVRYGW